MIITLVTFLFCTINTVIKVDGNIVPFYDAKSVQTYTPEFSALNIKEQMTLSPMFTPDNALDIHTAWIDRANSTIDIQIPYITAFDAGDDGEDWDSDSSPIVRALIGANNTRGVNIRIQLNEDSDSDNVTYYFQSKGIDVRWMGTLASKAGDSYISTTHTKLLIIDEKVTLLSSINFSFKGLTDNREAGMVIKSETVAEFYTQVFESDWADGEKPPSSSNIYSTNSFSTSTNPKNKVLASYPSHTNIERANFTGNYNVTLFTNPDSADEVIFRFLNSARSSIYVSMYTISRPDFNDTLIDLKNSNPSMDIQVLISNDRVGPQEDIDTIAAAKSLVENLIPVYNSTKDGDKVNGFYHNKYWIIDGTHVFVYSGNWSPRSVTPQLEPEDPYYSSTEMNRDMGIAVHDASDIASFFKTVWDADVAVAEAWDLPIGVKQTSFSDTDVVSGTVMLTGQVSGLENATVSYRWGSSGEYTDVNVINKGFSIEFDTLTLPNGITDFEVKAETSSLTFSDQVKVNIINYASNENWRLLITELLPNPAVVSDTEGEYIELTNSFPFDLFIEDWQIGDDNELYTFTSDYTIGAYTSIIIARDPTGFMTGYTKTADIELGIALKNDGDYAQLLDHEGSYMDVVAYGDVTAPDSSEVVDAPDSGEAIIRTQMHIDTNKASDFTFSSPDPKGSVPQVPLNTGIVTSDSEDTAYSISAIFLALALLPYLKRRKVK
jgi:phosphatidylserine/phosphatidylglycerophosphate/cardiolipin synthase-like enzyme